MNLLAVLSFLRLSQIESVSSDDGSMMQTRMTQKATDALKISKLESSESLDEFDISAGKYFDMPEKPTDCRGVDEKIDDALEGDWQPPKQLPDSVQRLHTIQANIEDWYLQDKYSGREVGETSMDATDKATFLLGMPICPAARAASLFFLFLFLISWCKDASCADTPSAHDEDQSESIIDDCPQDLFDFACYESLDSQVDPLEMMMCEDYGIVKSIDSLSELRQM